MPAGALTRLQLHATRLFFSLSHREDLIIDLGRDSPPEEPVATTDLGPTLSPRDLAARKTLALFGRAEARDFAAVYDLGRRYGRDTTSSPWPGQMTQDSTCMSSRA